jgi:hypothetical protein
VLLALCGRLSSIQQLRRGLADRLCNIQAMTATNTQKQGLIDAEVKALLLQLRAAGQVSLRLLEYCSSGTAPKALAMLWLCGLELERRAN